MQPRMGLKGLVSNLQKADFMSDFSQFCLVRKRTWAWPPVSSWMYFWVGQMSLKLGCFSTSRCGHNAVHSSLTNSLSTTPRLLDWQVITGSLILLSFFITYLSLQMPCFFMDSPQCLPATEGISITLMPENWKLSRLIVVSSSSCFRGNMLSITSTKVFLKSVLQSNPPFWLFCSSYGDSLGAYLLRGKSWYQQALHQTAQSATCWFPVPITTLRNPLNLISHSLVWNSPYLLALDLPARITVMLSLPSYLLMILLAPTYLESLQMTSLARVSESK